MYLLNGVNGVSAQFPVVVEGNSVTEHVYQKTVLMTCMSSRGATKCHVNVSILYSYVCPYCYDSYTHYLCNCNSYIITFV